MATKDKTYGEHRVGSRKSKVYEVYLEQGREKALVFGQKEGLKDSTLRSWFSTWNIAGKVKKPVVKKATAKKTAKVIPISAGKKAKKKVA